MEDGKEDPAKEKSEDNDDAPAIPEGHYYSVEDVVSKPFTSEHSGLPADLLTLHHSFGYDCHRRANLHILDENMSIYIAGNFAQLLNFKTKEQQYLRSTSGGGIGALAVHPSHTYFAVAEKGDAPNILIYEYPSLKLFRVLRGGTGNAYSFVDFSPDGRLLASVGGDPDYMLTIWDWRQEKTVLRCKAFSQEVFRVTFSTELIGQLTSSGTGHIRFWKMAKTFTGLKLQGELGKFGRTEISDIEGYVELPDGKVLSGAEVGNMLLWDGGLIKVEIARKGKKPCHTGLIQQIIMDEGELMTIGEDGYIRVWDFETIDTADAVDESNIFEMEPMNELKVGNDVRLRSIVKSVNSEEPVWYAQDMNGGIWKLDLSFSFTSQAPEKLMSYHSGTITAVDTSPVTHLVATTGIDRSVRVYDYMLKQLLCEARYNRPGTTMTWLPKEVDPSGSSILVGFEDGVVRALTIQKRDAVDVHGRKVKDQSELDLKQVFKPHNGQVTAMAVDCNGEILATGSDDHTVFFLSISSNYEPIGFINTPSPVTHMEWSPSGTEHSTLLVCCLEGQCMEIQSPGEGTFDTSKTYQISGLDIRMHDFKSIKSHLRHEEELERQAKEEEERKKQEEKERRLRIERGLETEEDQIEEEKKPEEQDEWKPYIPEEPSPILCGLHAQEAGKFWLSMGDFDAGYLYECQFMSEEEKLNLPPAQVHKPVRNVSVKGDTDVAVTAIRFSDDRKRAIFGFEDGSVRIYPLATGDLAEIKEFWSLTVHDNNYGSITHIATSYDGNFLFTVGKDGNFFAFKVMGEEALQEKIAEARAKIPSAKKTDDEKHVDDIEDPNAYSIEDAKQKAEHDKMVEMAEAKKSGVRRMIEGLRTQFRKLLDKNQDLPSHLQLDRKEFEMDPEIKRELERQTNTKIENVKKEMAWEQEKHRIALEKLRWRFKDVVDCEHIIVKAFLTPHEVSTFRNAKLPDDFYAAKEEMERRKTTMLSKEEASRQATQEFLRGQATTSGDLTGKDSGQKGESLETKVTTTLKGNKGERINKALAKVEEKKRKRQLRRNQWAELYGSKPDDNYEDPADVAAIREAKENMGDYKLKSADDYVVPDHLRMNVEKAITRLLVMKDMLYQHKTNFNERLLGIRDKKLSVIEEIRSLVAQLEKVQLKLGPDKAKSVPEIPRMHPEELPEKKFEFTRETLLKWKVDHAARIVAEAKAAAEAGGFGGGFGNVPPTQAANAYQPSPSPTSSKQASGLTGERTMDTDWTFTHDEANMSDMERRLMHAEEIRLLYERDSLLKQIDNLLKNFDAELRCLRHEKFLMDVNLKNADLRHVTLFEELLLLKEFEKRENLLVEKLEGKQLEKLDMQAKVIEVQGRLDVKKKDIEKLQDKERALHATFLTSLGENNKFTDFLTKVFRKRIKRSKKKLTEGEGSDDDSEDESDDESDWSESEEESDSESGGYDLDICPPHCDQTLYDNTCALREKRLDIEEGLADEKKTRDTFTKDLDSLTKKSRVIDSALKQAENELEAFQLEKQRKLNELDVVVTLKLSQIQYCVNGMLPQDLAHCLIFTAAGVGRLQHRIKELEQEKTTQKKQQKDAKKKHVKLTKDRKTFEARISEMDDQCNSMMLQKFGRIVDLEKLETVTVNRSIEESKERLRQNEIACTTEMKSWEEKIVNSKDDITNLIRANTRLLDQLNMLLGEKKDYQLALDARQKNLMQQRNEEGGEFSGARQADVHERQRLIQLVHLQAQEIEALKEEITLLSRKGGHILPPAQPPLPQSAQGQLPPVPNN